MFAIKTKVKSVFAPITVWIVTGVILALLLTLVSVYDYYEKRNNPYINRISDRVDNFEREGGKPLVVLVGASLEMLATYKDWQNPNFQWLRLIIQGSKISEFNRVSERIIAVNPDLVLLGLHLFKPASFAVRSRETLNGMVRIPLEHFRLISRRLRFEQKNCTGSVWTMDRTLGRLEKEFRTEDNSLSDSNFLGKLRNAGVPTAVVRSPLVDFAEREVVGRKRWLDKIRSDAKSLDIEIISPGWEIGRSYFCRDLLHMNESGRAKFVDWLESVILNKLGQDK